MFKLRLKVTGMKEVRRMLRRAPDRMEQANKRALHAVSQEAVKAMKLTLRRNRSIAFGYLANSIWYKIQKKRNGFYSEVGPGMKNLARSAHYGNPVDYGFFVEYGRGPGGVPVDVIQVWAREKTGQGDIGTARAIAAKIAKRGVRAKPFVGPVYKKRNELARVYRRVIEKEINRLDRS